MIWLRVILKVLQLFITQFINLPFASAINIQNKDVVPQPVKFRGAEILLPQFMKMALLNWNADWNTTPRLIKHPPATTSIISSIQKV